MNNSQITANLIKKTAKSKKIAISKLLSDCELNKNALYTMQSEGYYPRVEALIKIADYLGCSIDYLLGRTDNPKAHESSVTPAIVEINNDKQQLLKMFDLLTEREKGEIIGILKEKTRERVSDKNTRNAVNA